MIRLQSYNSEYFLLITQKRTRVWWDGTGGHAGRGCSLTAAALGTHRHLCASVLEEIDMSRKPVTQDSGRPSDWGSHGQTDKSWIGNPEKEQRSAGVTRSSVRDIGAMRRDAAPFGVRRTSWDWLNTR
jgi:hypothetical protein